jgi:DNA-binding Lrp family transcriptional regulator
MDDTDKALLRALTDNGRASVSDLARALHLARTTEQSRLDRLEASGTIAGYTIRLGGKVDKAKIRATVLLQIRPRSTPAILPRLRTMDAVERAVSASGRFDLILQLCTDSTAELDDTLDRIGAIDGVVSSESLIHLGTKIDRGG